MIDGKLAGHRIGIMIRPFRTIALALVLPITGLLGGTAQAHDGPHGPDVLAEVHEAQVQGSHVVVELVLTNLGGPLVLTGLSADGAAPVAIRPVYFDFAEDAGVSQRLDFGKSPPAQFRLNLEFGVMGAAAVTVVPKRGP